MQQAVRALLHDMLHGITHLSCPRGPIFGQSAQVSRAHALVDELRMRVAARVPAELEAQCAALAARGGLGPPPPGAMVDDPLPLPDPGAPGWAGADADGAADGGESEELAKRCFSCCIHRLCGPWYHAMQGLCEHTASVACEHITASSQCITGHLARGR